MNISAKIRNAVRLMLCLAVHFPGEYISLRKISSFTFISIKYLEQLIPDLRESGLVSSLQGKTGGYKLTRDPAGISLFDIYTSYSGTILFRQADDDGAGLDDLAWKDMDELLRTALKNKSLGKLKKDFLDSRGFINYVI